MRTEASNAQCFTIFDAGSLDPITVVIQDFGGSGRVIVECYGEAWSTYFGAIGDRSMREFIADCHPDYVANRLAKKVTPYIRRISGAVIDALLAKLAEVKP